jgi:beta-lactam-binding protein with PASTA domain
MAFRDSFWSAVAWLRALGENVYFWGGAGVLFLLCFGVYLVVDAVIMPSYTRHDVSTQVPNVENLPYEEAKERLQDRDLQVERQVGRYNPNVDTGLVVDQTPLPSSKVKPGRRVYLTVNAGEIPTVQIPDLNGMSVREAKNRISSLGLQVGRVQEDPIPSPYAQTITKQTPSPGDSLQEGEAVHLWYSTGLGESQVEVPNVVGERVETAQQRLLERELRHVVVDTSTTTEASSQDGGTGSGSELFVLRQGHSPGSSVPAGTEIRLFTTNDSTEAAAQREAEADTSGPSPDSTESE